MSEQPSLKREGTMQVTAQEGEAFLESQGMKVTDDDVKTRGQKEKLDQLTTPTEEESPKKPRLPRDGTMAVTAKEGQELLGDESLEKTRQQTAASKEEGSANGDESKPRIPRDNTMVVTAQEGQALLEGEQLEKTRAQTAAAKEEEPPKVKRATTIAQTTEASAYILGDEELGKTRSETKETRKSLSESEEDKPAVKRANTMEQTAKEGEEYLAREAKRVKVDTENGSAQEETKAES